MTNKSQQLHNIHPNPQMDQECQQTYEDKIPQEVVFSLQQGSVDDQSKTSEQMIHSIINPLTVGQLQTMLKGKIQQVNSIKKVIANRKLAIKQIGNKIDREVEKTLFRQNITVATVSIKQIFKSPSQLNPKVKELREELNNIRKLIQKQKEETIKIEKEISDPISSSNIVNALKIDAKIKQRQAKIKQIKRQKQILSQQIQRLKEQVPIQQQECIIQDFKKLNQQSNNVLAKIKQQKLKVYELERLDCMITQKMMYMKDVVEQSDMKKNLKCQGLTQNEKLQISAKIKILAGSIRQNMEQKIKIQIQRENIVKSLINQVNSLEKKKFETTQNLRQIGSFLQKYNTAKLKDPKYSLRKKQKIQRSAIYSVKTYDNEKFNHQISLQPTIIEPVFIQKKKIIQLGTSPPNEQNITLSDDFIGNKQKIEKICLLVDQERIYGFHADYINQFKHHVRGMNMLSKIRPKDLKQISLIIQNDDYLNSIKVGLNHDFQICYLKLQTTKLTLLQWGTTKEVIKTQEKSIKKYESINVRSKLVNAGVNQNPNTYCIGSIGFSIIYLGIK